MNEGDAYVVRFAEPGVYEYIDTLHSTMKGKIVVERLRPDRRIRRGAGESLAPVRFVMTSARAQVP